MDFRRVSILLIYTEDGRVLIQNRTNIEKNKKLPEKLRRNYGMFGGGIEKGETPEQALKREIKEELELDIDELPNVKFMKKVEFQNLELNQSRELNIFTCKVKEIPKVICHEGEAAIFNIDEAIEKLSLSKNDRKILEEIKMLSSKNILSSNFPLKNEKSKDSQVKVLAQGAEAIIIREGNSVIKDRISKKYRHPELDKKIIKTRTKKEAKLLERASKLIPCPLPINLKEIEKSKLPNKIEMPFIEGKKLSEHLENLDWKNICKIIGNQIAKLHDNSIIHGDLTTSNMIWDPNHIHSTPPPQHPNHSFPNSIDTSKNKKEVAELVQATSSYPRLYFIDFGLGFTSSRNEDKAVDLHLIKQALEAKHFSIHKEAEKIILENYNSKDKAKVLEQLKKVELRGRYKGC